MTTNFENKTVTPLLLANNLVENVWGGHWLAAWKGVQDTRTIGEAWEFSVHPQHPGQALRSDGSAIRAHVTASDQ